MRGGLGDFCVPSGSWRTLDSVRVPWVVSSTSQALSLGIKSLPPSLFFFQAESHQQELPVCVRNTDIVRL